MFEEYIPRLKVGMFFKEYAEQLLENDDAIAAKLTTRAEIARQTWDRVENRLGEMNFDNLFWDRTFKSAMQLAFRSVTWKMGTLRAGMGAIKGQVSELSPWIGQEVFDDPLRTVQKAGAGRGAPKMDPNFAWLLGVSAMTAMIGTIVNYAFNGEAPKTLTDLVHPRVGGEDDRGKPNRISLPTYFRDFESFRNSPARYASGSLATIWSRMPELWNNKDFFGNYVYNPEDPMWKKVLEGLGHVVNTPFSFANYERVKEQSGSKAAEILSFLGFTKGPRYVDMSSAEKVADEIVMKTFENLPPREEAAKQRAQLRKEILRQMKTNAPEAYDKMLQLLAEGKLDARDLSEVNKRARQSWLQSMVQDHMKAADAMKVWRSADRTEKLQLVDIMITKINRSRTLSTDKKSEYMNEVLEDAYGISNPNRELTPPPGPYDLPNVPEP